MGSVLSRQEEQPVQRLYGGAGRYLVCLGNRVKDDVAGGLGSEGEGLSLGMGWVEARQNGAWYIRRGILPPSIGRATRS